MLVAVRTRGANLHMSVFKRPALAWNQRVEYTFPEAARSSVRPRYVSAFGTRWTRIRSDVGPAERKEVAARQGLGE